MIKACSLSQGQTSAKEKKKTELSALAVIHGVLIYVAKFEFSVLYTGMNGQLSSVWKNLTELLFYVKSFFC